MKNELLKSVKKALDNILHFSVGTLRYKLYYSYFDFLIRRNIRKQIKFRIEIMDNQCFEQGSCKMCGCNTTALQMADKQCPKPCYPNFMSKKTWWKFWGQEEKVLSGNDWWKLETKFDLEEVQKLYRTLILYKNDRVISTNKKLYKDYAKKPE